MDLSERVVEAVRKYPCLWDPSSLEYRDRRMKDEAWKAVIEEVGDNRTLEEVRKLWRYLRDYYVKEKRKLERRSGSAAGKQGSSWGLFGIMDFLRGTVSHRQTEGNLVKHEPDEDSSRSTDDKQTVGDHSDAGSSTQDLDAKSSGVASEPDRKRRKPVMSPSAQAEEDDWLTDGSDSDAEAARTTASTESTARAEIAVVMKPSSAKPAEQSSSQTTDPAAAGSSKESSSGSSAASSAGSSSSSVSSVFNKGKRGRASIEREIDLEILKVIKGLQAGASAPSTSASTSQSRATNASSSEDRPSKDAELDSFGRMVVETLSRLAPRTRAVTKVRIQELLLDAEFPPAETEDGSKI